MHTRKRQHTTSQRSSNRTTRSIKPSQPRIAQLPLVVVSEDSNYSTTSKPPPVTSYTHNVSQPTLNNKINHNATTHSAVDKVQSAHAINNYTSNNMHLTQLHHNDTKHDKQQFNNITNQSTDSFSITQPTPKRHSSHEICLEHAFEEQKEFYHTLCEPTEIQGDKHNQLNDAFVADNAADLNQTSVFDDKQFEHHNDISMQHNDVDVDVAVTKSLHNELNDVTLRRSSRINSQQHSDIKSEHSNIKTNTAFKQAADVWWQLHSIDNLHVAHYLPELMADAYTEITGISTLWPWQRDCLQSNNLLHTYKNLVFSASTSAGKTAVAEILLLRHVLIYHKQCYFVLPFVAIVDEKFKVFNKIIQSYNKTIALKKRTYNSTNVKDSLIKYRTLIVKAVHGQQPRTYDNTTPDIIICTTEKAYFMFSKHLYNKTFNQIGCVVIDEIHMIGDETRGYTIESMLTKLLYAQQKYRIKIHSRHSKYNNNTPAEPCQRCNDQITPLQLIAMSATVTNLECIAQWLHAIQYATDWRPVPLHMVYVKNRTLFNNSNENHIRQLPVPKCSDKSIVAQYNKLKPKLNAKQADGTIANELIITELVWDEIKHNNNVLVFCATRQQTRLLARRICELLHIVKLMFPRTNTDIPVDTDNELIVEQQRNKLRAALIEAREQPDEILLNSVLHGIAYHNADLNGTERKLIEDAYKANTLHGICATTSLSTGINLPARIVIFHTLLCGYNALDQTQFMQMCGRAGRIDYSTSGEAIIIVNNESDIVRAQQYMNGNDEAIISTLCITTHKRNNNNKHAGNQHLIRLLLDALSNELATNGDDLESYVSCTLMSQQLELTVAVKAFADSLRQLRKSKLIDETTSVHNTDMIRTTHAGSATYHSGLSMHDYEFVTNILNVLQSCWIDEPNNLQLMYCIVPIQCNLLREYDDWSHYNQMFKNLPESYKTLCQLLGLNQEQIDVCTYNTGQTHTDTLIKYERFYGALILTDISKQMDTTDVCNKYKISDVTLRQIYNETTTFAHKVHKLAMSLNWSDIVVLLEYIIDALVIRVSDEVKPLMDAIKMKPDYAAALYNAGYTTVHSILHAKSDDICKLLLMSQQFAWHDTDDSSDSSILNDTLNIIEQATHYINQLKESNHSEYIHTLAVEKNMDAAEQLQQQQSQSIRQHIDVCTSVDRFDEFITEWKQQKLFTFTLYGITRVHDMHSANNISYTQSTLNTSIHYDSDENYIFDSDDEEVNSGTSKTMNYIKKVSSYTINKYNITRDNITGMIVAYNDKNNNTLYYNIVCDEYVRTQDYQCYDLSNDVIWYNIAQVVTNSQCIKQSMDMKSHCVLLQLCGVDMYEQLRDPRIAHWLLDTDNNKELFSIQHLFDIYYNRKTRRDILNTVPKSRKNKRISSFNESQSEYQHIPYDTTTAVEHCYLTSIVMSLLYDKLCTDNIEHVFNTLEMPMVPILANIEYHGITFNKDNFMLTYRQLQCKAQYCELYAHKVAKQCFNLADGEEVSDVLFSKGRKGYKFDIPIQSKGFYQYRGKSTGKPRVDKDVLEALIVTSDHVLPCLIREWRALQSHIGLAEQYKNYALYDTTIQQHRVYTTVNHTASATGRLTFCNANLQNITKQLTYIPVMQLNLCQEMAQHLITVDVRGHLNSDTKPLHECTREYLMHSQTLSGTPRNKYKQQLVHCIDMHGQLQRGRLVQVLNRSIFEPYSTKHSTTLAQQWYTYSKEQIQYNDTTLDIKQVRVKIYQQNSALNNTHLYPADRVYREAAFIHDPSKLDSKGYFRVPNAIKATQQSLNVQLDDTEIERTDHMQQAKDESTIQYSNWYTLQSEINVHFRQCFIARPGYTLLQADYDQVELRFWAHMSNDTVLSDILNNNTADVFRSMASQFFQCKYNTVTTDMRQLIKHLVYAMLYGCGDSTLAKRLQIPLEEATQYRKKFFGAYPGIKPYMNKVIEDCRNNNRRIKSILGRVRIVKDIDSNNRSDKASGERVAISSVIQGSSSDLTKTAMLEIQQCIREIGTELNDHNWAYCVLSVHDELVYEVKTEYLQKLAPIVKDRMENCIKLSVPLKVKASYGQSWGTLKDINFSTKCIQTSKQEETM